MPLVEADEIAGRVSESDLAAIEAGEWSQTRVHDEDALTGYRPPRKRKSQRHYSQTYWAKLRRNPERYARVLARHRESSKRWHAAHRATTRLESRENGTESLK